MGARARTDRGRTDPRGVTAAYSPTKVTPMGSVWGEYLPNWIAAVGTALGFLAAGVAAFLTWRALRQDLDKDRIGSAAGLSAWWVTTIPRGDDPKKWGVLVRNGSSTPYYAVEVYAQGNNHRFGSEPIRLPIVPPGKFFVESAPKKERMAWIIAETSTNASFNPILYGTDQRVTSILYSDNRGFHWEWDPDRGIRAAKKSSR